MKFIYLLLLAIPLACSNSESSSTLNAFEYSDDVQAAVELEAPIVTEKSTAQKLIKESYLSYETEDMDQSYTSLATIISKYNGYIQDDNESKGYQRVSRQIVVRLPSENFQNAIDDISKDVPFFDTKRINSRDVTEEFIDLSARLKAKQTLEKRYLELLSKAKNVKEILEIERELSTIREEIEAKQGRLKYLENKVSLSTLTINFYKTTAESRVTQSYGSKMWKAVKSGFNGLSTFFLSLLHIWPLILIFTAVFVFIKRRFFKKKKA